MNIIQIINQDITLPDKQENPLVDNKQVQPTTHIFLEKLRELESYNKEASLTIDTLVNSIELQNKRQLAAEKRSNDLEKELRLAKYLYEQSKIVQKSNDKATEEKFAALNKLFQESQQQTQKTIQALESKVNTLTAENNLRESEISALTIKNNILSSTITTVSELATSLKEMSDKMSNLEQRDNGQDNCISGLNDRVNFLERYIRGSGQNASVWDHAKKTNFRGMGI